MEVLFFLLLVWQIYVYKFIHKKMFRMDFKLVILLFTAIKCLIGIILQTFTSLQQQQEIFMLHECERVANWYVIFYYFLQKAGGICSDIVCMKNFINAVFVVNIVIILVFGIESRSFFRNEITGCYGDYYFIYMKLTPFVLQIAFFIVFIKIQRAMNLKLKSKF